MQTFYVIFAVISVARGIDYDGLRVKFGWSDALADLEYFFNIPRTTSDAENAGWKPTERPTGALPGLKMYCPRGRAVCPLFDKNGFIAGLQIALLVDSYESAAVKPEKQMVKWQAPASEGEPAREYWTLTQYFAPEGTLKAGTGPLAKNGSTLQYGGVWVTGNNGKLMKIPSTAAELNSTAFKKQNCIPNMGTHYFYNMTRDMKCEDSLPWFALVNQGQLVGTGFQLFGSLGRQNYRDWFERPSLPRLVVETVIPIAPDCLRDWATLYGIVSMHIYYINKPWSIRCQVGDSAQPVPAIEELILDDYRYANQVSDELQRIFIEDL